MKLDKDHRNENQNAVIAVRVSVDFKQKLEQLAKADHRKLGSFVRLKLEQMFNEIQN